jgi:23S rRNA pseudouridine2605 synthase
MADRRKPAAASSRNPAYPSNGASAKHRKKSGRAGDPKSKLAPANAKVRRTASKGKPLAYKSKSAAEKGQHRSGPDAEKAFSPKRDQDQNTPENSHFFGGKNSGPSDFAGQTKGYKKPSKANQSPPAARGTGASPKAKQLFEKKPKFKEAAPAAAPNAAKISSRPQPTSLDDPQRIAKVIARAGVCSRRDAESFIEEGRVTLNGNVLTSPAVNIGAGDDIRIDGQPLAQRERTRLFLFHKPRGLVTTDYDPEGRPTIFDHLRRTWVEGPRVVSIGRLDINTEGLLLLTNDGGLARVLELPSTGWTRRYRVRANGQADQAMLDKLRVGVAIDGIDYAGIEATLDRQQGANSWMTITLHEGKNREVKRVLEHLGLFVNRLIRLSFGPFQLGDLAEGELSEVRTRVLADQLGPVLSASAGVDFSSPLFEEQKSEPQVSVKSAKSLRPAKEEEPRPRHRKETLGSIGPASARTQAVKTYFAKPAPEGGKPESKTKLARPAPGPRKHISALRDLSAFRSDTSQPIAHEKTADRKGRVIAVERIASSGDDRSKSAASTRNSRRFAAEKSLGRSLERTSQDLNRKHGRVERDGAPPRPDRSPSERMGPEKPWRERGPRAEPQSQNRLTRKPRDLENFQAKRETVVRPKLHQNKKSEGFSDANGMANSLKAGTNRQPGKPAGKRPGGPLPRGRNH